MADCDDLEEKFLDELEAQNELLDDIHDDQREQFENYKEYHSELTDAYFEFVILGLFGEGALGGALGGYSAFLSPTINNLESKIDQLHDKIEQEKAAYDAARDKANAAAQALCQCYWENGGMPL